MITQSDIEFIINLLPSSYEVQAENNHINCFSRTGIRKGDCCEDDEHWDYIFKAIKSRFGNRFIEVFHNTCAYHINFNIYLKP